PGARPYPPAGTSRADHRRPAGRALGAPGLVRPRRLPRDRPRRAEARPLLVILTPGGKKGARENRGQTPILPTFLLPTFPVRVLLRTSPQSQKGRRTWRRARRKPPGRSSC